MRNDAPTRNGLTAVVQQEINSEQQVAWLKRKETLSISARGRARSLDHKQENNPGRFHA
jgi:hypothetical protein